jgi:D-beta-D-heptose 7-phosphate kinase / D-beta-D-heptose 1-phosphate adenosyltransferase
MSFPLVIVGDSLLDIDLIGQVKRLAPDAPVPVLSDGTEVVRPGGAALCATLAAVPVVLITTLAEDADADRLTAALPSGVELVRIPGKGTTPVKTRLRSDGHAIARVDRGQVEPAPALPAEIRDAIISQLRGAGAILVADYGNGTVSHPQILEALQAVADRVPIVWDPHPRGCAPIPNVALATPNHAEAAAATGVAGEPKSLHALANLADRLREQWKARSLAVTCGARGAVLSLGGGMPFVVPAPPIAAAPDTCGAGDRFAVAAALALRAGELPTEAVTKAVAAASEFVAAGGAGGLATAAAPLSFTSATRDDVIAAAAKMRDAGATLVATGGCFDLLHAGHVATLQAARSLGDALVVCLNSDDSVRRLKGADRPLQPARDRARILSALSCVDAVLVFEEDTPLKVLRELRPHVWVKGGDYTDQTLPEAAAIAAWGGQVVAVPYLPERSTSRLVDVMRVSSAAAPAHP